jgi:hypothetical protein
MFIHRRAAKDYIRGTLWKYNPFTEEELSKAVELIILKPSYNKPEEEYTEYTLRLDDESTITRYNYEPDRTPLRDRFVNGKRCKPDDNLL